ncbi:hypothetical protein D3C85_1328590 [compost metagenome]
MFGVLRDIGNHWLGLPCPIQIRGDQDDAGQRRVEHRQLVKPQGLAFEFYRLLAIEHRQDCITGMRPDVAGHHRQLRCCFECGFLTPDDFFLQERFGHGVDGQQHTLEVPGVTDADIQFATQSLELSDGHLVFERLDVEQPTLIGLADEIRIGFTGFRACEVVQCGVQQ